MYNWNDLRHFLAVTRAGSTVEAAALVKVNQSPVSRRIGALEAALGAKLFDKAASGYQLTELGRDLLPAAERAEMEAEAVLQFVELGVGGLPVRSKSRRTKLLLSFS